MSKPIELFAERFRALSGEFHAVPDAEGAAKVAARIVQDESAACVALAHLSDELHSPVRAAFGKDIRVLEPPYPSKGLPELLDAAQVGLTGVEWGIAETATLVEVCTDDAVRLVAAASDRLESALGPAEPSAREVPGALWAARRLLEGWAAEGSRP